VSDQQERSPAVGRTPPEKILNSIHLCGEIVKEMHGRKCLRITKEIMPFRRNKKGIKNKGEKYG
jgi:hypothetical protein